MRVVIELGTYFLGLCAALVAVSVTTYGLLASFSVPVALGMMIFPCLLGATFLGFHKSFDFAVELFENRRDLIHALKEMELPSLRAPQPVRVPVRRR